MVAVGGVDVYTLQKVVGNYRHVVEVNFGNYRHLTKLRALTKDTAIHYLRASLPGNSADEMAKQI